MSYDGAHKRVTKARGRASAHCCAMNCGRQAAHWSIVRTDSAPMPHSPDPQDYRPLCVPCHKRYDMAALINEGWPHKRPVP